MPFRLGGQITESIGVKRWLLIEVDGNDDSWWALGIDRRRRLSTNDFLFRQRDHNEIASALYAHQSRPTRDDARLGSRVDQLDLLVNAKVRSLVRHLMTTGGEESEGRKPQEGRIREAYIW